MKRLPGDPRSGETGHVLVSLSETVQGGFGSGPLPVEKAAVMFSITRPDGAVVAGNIAATEELGGLYRGSYQFDSAGDYKMVVSVNTEDKRTFSAEFPVTVSRAPIRTSFWVGLLILPVLSGISFAVVFYALKRRKGIRLFGDLLRQVRLFLRCFFWGRLLWRIFFRLLRPAKRLQFRLTPFQRQRLTSCRRERRSPCRKNRSFCLG
ncbi:MAG: hypothetical protein IPK01_13605 [Acidobacteria bacterium]|nr:hypothetical protein [Acidobacteriota bacterium]